MEKTFINVAVRESTHRQLMIFKIKSKAKNLDAVIKELIKAFNKKF